MWYKNLLHLLRKIERTKILIAAKLCTFFFFLFATDEESPRGITDEEQGQDNATDDQCDTNSVQFSDSLRSVEMGKSRRIKKEDGKLRAVSGRPFNHQGKNLRIHVPLTNPTRTFSYLLWDDLINQSSKKYEPGGSKVHINKTKLHHAEKMIKGALIELYKGLGYLKTYRYAFDTIFFPFN